MTRVARGAAVAVLALLMGTGLWVRFVYDESPGPHRVTVAVPRGEGVVAFRLERYVGFAAPVSEIVTVGDWTEEPRSTLRTEQGPARATYRGTVGERADVVFDTAPDGGRARVIVDGATKQRVDLVGAADGTRVVRLRFDERVPPASWALLVVMIAVSALGASAAIWALAQVVERRDRRSALLVGAGSALLGVIVAVLPYVSPSVVRAAGGALPVLDRIGLGVTAALGAVLVAALVIGVRPPPAPAWVRTPETARDRWRLTALLGLVPFVGWLALLLLFWPGLMNPDSVIQWFELDRTGLDDWHPYSFAVVVGVLRHVADTPALPVLLQVVGASALVGRIAAWTIWRGRRPWVAAATLVLLPVLPPTGLFTVTLWKDTAYGILLLALALVVWRVEDTQGRWLAEGRNVALAALTLTGLWLSRHNGWPVVVVTVLVLLLAHRAWWRRTALAVVAAAAVALVVQIPLASLLDVRENRVPSIVSVQHIARHVNEGTRIEPSERAFLREIYPLNREWPYGCSSIQVTWSGPQAIPLERYTDKGSELRSLAIELALRDPGVELAHLACASELIWKPGDDRSATYFLEWSDTAGRIDYIPRIYDDTPSEDPGSPRAVARIFGVVTDVLPIWAIRPALYLYALLLAIAWAAWRRRSWGVVRIAVPAIAQSLVLAALTLVQDVRFQYGVMLTAVVMVPALITVTRREGPDDEVPLRWQ